MRQADTPRGIMSRITRAFGALVIVQTGHSIEEYVGRLWESFPPAILLTGLISSDRRLGFLIVNGLFVAFGFWCLLWPVRKRWPAAPVVVSLWVLIETINGIVHPAWSVRQGGYTPGVLTAPLLLGLALYLGVQLWRTPRPASAR